MSVLLFALDTGAVKPPTGIAVRAAVAWLVIIGVESIHGVLRIFFLAPLVGDLAARQIGVFIGSALIFLVAWWLIEWIGADTRRALVLVGIIWITLTLSFEIGIGHYVMHRSWELVASDYKITEGGLLPLGMILLGVAPLLAAKWRGIELRQ